MRLRIGVFIPGDVNAPGPGAIVTSTALAQHHSPHSSGGVYLLPSPQYHIRLPLRPMVTYSTPSAGVTAKQLTPQWIRLPSYTHRLLPHHFIPLMLIKNLSAIPPLSYFSKSKLRKPKYVTWTYNQKAGKSGPEQGRRQPWRQA